jgi:hypothetical protein
MHTALLWPIHTYHAVPLQCHENAVLKATSQGHSRVAAGERHGMCESAFRGLEYYLEKIR